MIVCKDCQKPVYRAMQWKCHGCNMVPEVQKQLPPPAIVGPDIDVKYVHPEIVVDYSHEDFNLDSMVKAHILSTLKKLNGNKMQTARVLGICIKTLYSKLEIYRHE